MMKAYKIDLSMLEGEAREDVSAAIQRHAFRLGYGGWISCGKNINNTSSPYLFIQTQKMMKTEMISTDEFNSDENTELSITDFLALKPEEVKDAPEFKPFDKVLVRDDDYDSWEANIFSYVQEGEPEYKYKCVFTCWKQCIPYEGNEHLLGTTEEPK